jgi:hypothetical protein
VLKPRIELAQDAGRIGPNGEVRVIPLDAFDKGFGHSV